MWALAGVGGTKLSHTLSHLSLRATQELDTGNLLFTGKKKGPDGLLE